MLTRAISLLATGIEAAQLVPVLSAQILTLLYCPGYFEAFVPYDIFATILGVIITCRFDMSFPLRWHLPLSGSY